MPITKKKCEYCKKTIYGTDRRKYCNSKCRQYAWRERKNTVYEHVKVSVIVNENGAMWKVERKDNDSN